MMARIEGQLPGTWQELEALVGRVLAECSYYVEVQKNVKLARGDVDIDVWADDHSSPPNVIAIECKRWKTSVPKNVVHAFRGVVGDSGANTGLLISDAGFQDGAVEAAQYSNVRLLTWDEFQQMFARALVRDIHGAAAVRRSRPAHRLHRAGSTHVSRGGPLRSIKVDWAEFRELRGKHALLGIGLMPLFIEMPGKPDGPAAPPLPLRESITAEAAASFPAAWRAIRAFAGRLKRWASPTRFALSRSARRGNPRICAFILSA
jgi:restriction system protein